MDTEGKNKSKYTVSNLVWLMVIIFAVWLVYASFLYLLSDKWDHSGAFGDMFGALNALFSGLAFAGIIFTILLQREELKLQRKELELARIEFKRTASAQEASQTELSKQAETLHKTAQINAIRTVVGIYQARREAEQLTTHTIMALDPKVGKYQQKLESLIENLEKE